MGTKTSENLIDTFLMVVSQAIGMAVSIDNVKEQHKDRRLHRLATLAVRQTPRGSGRCLARPTQCSRTAAAFPARAKKVSPAQHGLIHFKNFLLYSMMELKAAQWFITAFAIAGNFGQSRCTSAFNDTQFFKRSVVWPCKWMSKWKWK